MTILTEIAIIALLILFNGLLAMSEIALISSKKAKLTKLFELGNHGAGRALKLSETRNNVLASIQVGVTVIGVLAGVFSGATIATEVSKILTVIHPLLTPYADALGLGFVVVTVSYATLILGELVPKRLALNNPELIAARMSRFLFFLGAAFKPLVYALGLSTRFLLWLLGSDPDKRDTITADEVRFLIEEGAAAGVLDSNEEAMIKRVLRLDGYTVEELMTPRPMVIGLDVYESSDSVLQKIKEHHHSYFPVFNKSMDQPIGLLPVKSFLLNHTMQKESTVKDCLTEALFLPATIRADLALEKFRRADKHLAFVVDEYGGMAGIITVHDITQAIVGDLPNSNEGLEQEILKQKDGSLLVDGYACFQDLMEYLHLKSDLDEEFQTVGGLMMVKLRKLPAEGDSILLGAYKFEVTRMERNRVDKVLVSRIEPGEEHLD